MDLEPGGHKGSVAPESVWTGPGRPRTMPAAGRAARPTGGSVRAPSEARRKDSTAMTLNRTRATTATALAAGLFLGWLMGVLPRSSPTVHAGAGDRWGDSIVATGPIMIRYDERLKAPLTQDALYYLDYRAGRLYATVPSFQQSGGTARMIDSFAERDLVADFRINVEEGPRPHFLMTTGSLGMYSEGWAPLFVFETSTNQVATYKVQQQSVGLSSKASFELVEVRPISPAAQRP